MKPKLLVLELWGLGDLVIATPFLRAATEQFSVTLLANPFALELQPEFWPEVQVIPFTAPWTAFRHKYQLWEWPWPDILRLRRQLVASQFNYGLSARWDPRDHLLLLLSGARERLGFARLKSHRFLTRTLKRPDPLAHRWTYWQVAGQALGLTLPAREHISMSVTCPTGSGILLHSGARMPVRVWPLENFRIIAQRLREKKIPVQIACDPDQSAWWQAHGEQPVCPGNVTELLALIRSASAFVGNDSGPGHLASFYGMPTFTIFGPQLHEWFAPLSPRAEFFEGKACPYKPCSDYCRFTKPLCLGNATADEVWQRLEKFGEKYLLR